MTYEGSFAGLRIDFASVLVSVAMGCGHHRPPSERGRRADVFDPVRLPGDERVAIRSNADVVGRYGRQGEVAVEENGAGGLSLLEYGHRTAMEIRPDGTLSPSGMELIRRGDRVFLRVLWCYREGFYERRR